MFHLTGKKIPPREAGLLWLKSTDHFLLILSLFILPRLKPLSFLSLERRFSRARRTSTENLKSFSHFPPPLPNTSYLQVSPQHIVYFKTKQNYTEMVQFYGETALSLGRAK